jgi:hypothetical protein
VSETHKNCVIRTIRRDDYLPLSIQMSKLRQVSSTLLRHERDGAYTYIVTYFNNGYPTMVPEDSKKEIENVFDEYFALQVA